MTRLEEFVKRCADEGILGVTAGVFKTHKSPNGKYSYKANTTPSQYCVTMGECVGVTAEEYADELLNIMDAPSKKIIGECDKCFAFLVEGEEHSCDGKGKYILSEGCYECELGTIE